MAYVDQSKKRLIKEAINKCIPAGWKFTLRVVNHSTIKMTIRSAPTDLLAEMNKVRDGLFRGERNFIIPYTTYGTINTHYPEQFFGESLAAIRAIILALNTGNYNRSDVNTDYFDVGHHIDISVGEDGKPFEVIA